MVTRLIAPVPIRLSAVAPAWGGGPTIIPDYDAAEAPFFWDRLYDCAPPDAYERWRNRVIHQRQRTEPRPYFGVTVVHSDGTA